MRKAEAVILLMTLLSFLVAVYFYPEMPEKIASHWNAEGAVDGYMPRFWGMFLMPFISLAMLLLFFAIPRMDPLRQNINKFRNYFDGFIILVFLFLLYLYAITIAWNFGARFNMIQLLAPAFAALFFYAGVLMENAKRNWSIGMRTPWTLSSEKVWNKTHKITGKLFKVAGIIALLGIFFDKLGLVFVLAPVIAFSIFGFVYSYLEYRKERKK